MRFALLVVVVVAVALTPRLVSANQCPANRPFVGNVVVPLGCPAVVYVPQWGGRASPTPSLAVRRGDTDVDVTGAITQATRQLAVEYTAVDPVTCGELFSTRDEPFDQFTIDAVGANPGEQVHVVTEVGTVATFVIDPAGPCPATEDSHQHQLYCQAPVQDFWACEHPDDDGNGIPDDQEADAGCSTTGSSSAVFAVILIPLLLRSRSSCRHRAARS